MKKIFLYGSLAVMAIGMASCNDFLDDNRYPLDSQSNSPEFWNNSANLETQCNYFYNAFTGYGNGTGTNSEFYYVNSSTNPTDDQCSESFVQWRYTSVPSSSSYWSSPFTEIRRANYIINNVRTSTLADSEKQYYEGVARLMRAYEYFLLVKKYGDVQWESDVIDTSDDETIYSPRDDRDMVMDSVLADLNYACATIPTGSAITWNNSMAQAMKSDICLFEGTYCKYRTLADNGKAPDSSRAQKFLNECVTASEAVMNAGYSLCANYQDAYNSESLSGNSEIIFYKYYRDTILMHSLISYTTSSTVISGISKSAFDAFLFRDGKPKGLTSYDDTDVAEIPFETDANGKPVRTEYSIKKLQDVRDSRLAAITDSCLCFQGQPWQRSAEMNMTSASGYTVCKFDNVTLDYQSRINNNKSYTDAPIYWLPVVLCNFAEAKAELGTITQSDLDKSVNLLYARADLPSLSVSVGFSDPANDVGVSDIIWEVRRCRRCELMLDGFRYWDLVRWHMLDKLDTQKNPDILLGANVSTYKAWVDQYNAAANAYNATASAEDQVSTINYDADIATITNGYIDAHRQSLERTYESKYYFYPIPSSELTLNTQLTQNPGWPTSSD